MTDRSVDAGSAQGSVSLGNYGAASRPSQTNPSDHDNDAETSDAGDRLTKRARYWRRKNELVDQFVDQMNVHARPISVRDNVKLREEVTAPRYENDGRRSLNWSAALRQFLEWYNGYRFAHLRFRNPDGDLVRAPMENSHQPSYGNTYYARLKALERRVLAEFDDPHIAMLTLTGSTENATGGPRCPCDHLREVVDPFGRYVRKALHRSLDVEQWEYAKVLEHHKSGYGHLHVAVFVDGEVTEEDFHGAIDAHLKHCEIAGREAHDYYADSEDKRPISVSQIDPDAGLKRSRRAGVGWLEDAGVDPNADDVDFGVGNMSSYVAEYIGAHGEELFDRDIAELAFRAVCWSTPTQRVTFSPGANELIASELPDRADDGDDLPDEPVVYGETELTDVELNAAQDPDADFSFSDCLDDDQDWTLEGMGTMSEEGEELHELEQSCVDYVNVEDHPEADPPNAQPGERPYRNLVAD